MGPILQMRTLRFRGCNGFQRSCYHGSTRDPTGARPPPEVPGLRERWWGHWRLVHSRAFKGTVTLGRSHGRPPSHSPPSALPSPHAALSVGPSPLHLRLLPCLWTQPPVVTCPQHRPPLPPGHMTALKGTPWWPGPFKHSWTRNLSDGCSPTVLPLSSPALGPPGRPLQVAPPSRCPVSPQPRRLCRFQTLHREMLGDRTHPGEAPPKVRRCPRPQDAPSRCPPRGPQLLVSPARKAPGFEDTRPPNPRKRAHPKVSVTANAPLPGTWVGCGELGFHGDRGSAGRTRKFWRQTVVTAVQRRECT